VLITLSLAFAVTLATATVARFAGWG
jgi:hypothetical protein